MEKNTKNSQAESQKSTKTLAKPRILFGLLFIFISLVLTISFVSYLLQWKADQSQAGTMMDKTIKSSNMFGKLGDWLGNLFIFESLGIAAFIVAFLFFVFGTLILKKNYFKPWKTLGHSLFFICWLPIFMGAITKGQGVLSGVYGYQIMDFLKSIIGNFGMWMTVIVSILLYFVLEFNLRPSAIKNKLESINEKAKDKMSALMPNSSEEFEADQELDEMTADGNELPKEEPKSTFPNARKSEAEKIAPKGFPEVAQTNDLDTIKTPNSTSLDIEKSSPTVEVTLGPGVVAGAAGTGASNAASIGGASAAALAGAENFDFKVEVAETKDEAQTENKTNDLVEKHGLYDHKLDLAKFQMPTIDLLKDYGNEEISVNKEELEENKNKIVGLLKNFNVGIKEIKATIGPTVTLY